MINYTFLHIQILKKHQALFFIFLIASKYIRKVKRILSLILILILLCGCAIGEENLYINKDGSGKVTYSLTTDFKYADEIKEYLNKYLKNYSESIVLDGLSLKKQFSISSEFDNYENLGLDKNILNVEKINDRVVVTFNSETNHSNSSEEKITNENYDDDLYTLDTTVINAELSIEEFNAFIEDNNIEAYFSISINAYSLTGPKLIEGNPDKIQNNLIGPTTYYWKIKGDMNMNLVVEIGAPIYEVGFFIILFGAVSTITFLVVKKKKFLAKTN